MTCSHHSMADRRGRKLAVFRGLLIGGCAMVLSGCYTAKDTTGVIPADYRQRHPITIKETDRTVELFIGASRGGLNAYQRADVLAFAQSWKRESTGGVIIDQPTGTQNEIAAEEATREVRSILAGSGVPLYAINVRPYKPESRNAVATVRLNYPKMTAEAGPCGLWPADLGPTYEAGHIENKPYWNLGCATQRNLAAMVDNPQDLVQPRGAAPTYTARRTTVLDKYHRGESTATVYPDSNRGKISDVGQ
jgi:pilus assembly protein CpaD